MNHPRKKSQDTSQLSPSTTRPMIEAGRDLKIYDGTFNLVHGNQINHNEGSGIHILSKMIAIDAIHDACERYPPPNVHQGTRTRFLKVLAAWINNLKSECGSFWLHGPAGVGKSAILQALAELLSPPEGPIAASFFFGRGQGKRGCGDYLFSTLAYQLAVNVNGLRPYVDEVMQRNPTLPSKSMEVQLRTLIIEPFQRLETLPSHIQTVVIDGLDECQGDENQKAILHLIGDALTKHKLPLRFLIASRPEPHIRDGFDNPELLPVSRRLMLHDDFQTQNDIEKYLQDGFEDICRLKSQAMVHVEMPWPGKKVIDTLTRHACGQFIYAATVLKFVAQKSTHPIKQLDIVLHPHPSRATAFSELDCLYSQILSTHPNPVTLLRVLTTILALNSPQPSIVIEEILEMEKGEILVVLEGLHSLISLSADLDSSKRYIRIRHASFSDYLLDSTRSGDFFIDETTLDAHLSTSIFSMISNWIFKSSKSTESKPRGGTSYKMDCDTRKYMSGHLAAHLDMVRPTDGTLYMPDFDDDTWEYISHDLVTHLRDINNCVGLRKVAVKFEHQISNGMEDTSIIPFETLYSLIEPLSVAISSATKRGICAELLKVRKKYVAVLDICYRSVLSLVPSLPILGVVKSELLPFDALESICRLEGPNVPSILKRFMDSSSTSSRVRLSPHVIEFLTNKESAGVYYCDPIVSHFVLCRNIISTIFPPSWQDIPDSVVGFYQAFDINQFFGYHLNAPFADKVNSFDVQHTISFLDHLDGIHYFDHKWPLLRSGDARRIWHIWAAIKEVLLWLLKRKQDLCDTLAKRCNRLFDKILRQVLCLLSTETVFCSTHLVTIREPFRSFEVGISDVPAIECFTMAQQNLRSDRLIEAPILESNVPVLLSEDMLLLDLHTFELEKYFTDMERAGDFYIDSSNYFCQLFDMCAVHRVGKGSRRLQMRKHYNLVTTCISYLVHAQATIGGELYANLRPIPTVGMTHMECTRILKLLKASPHTPPYLYDAWEQHLELRCY